MLPIKPKKGINLLTIPGYKNALKILINGILYSSLLIGSFNLSAIHNPLLLLSVQNQFRN